MKKEKKNIFCRKCGNKLEFCGLGEFSDAGKTYNSSNGQAELAEIYVCPKNNFWNSYTHDEYRVFNGQGYYYF